MTRTGTALLFVAALAGACASSNDEWERSANAWIGSPFSKLAARYGEPSSVRLEANGDRAMRYQLREIDESCLQTWVVDKTNTIVGQYHYGHCR